MADPKYLYEQLGNEILRVHPEPKVCLNVKKFYLHEFPYQLTKKNTETLLLLAIIVVLFLFFEKFEIRREQRSDFAIWKIEMYFENSKQKIRATPIATT